MSSSPHATVKRRGRRRRERSLGNGIAAQYRGFVHGIPPALPKNVS
jgi:hypothetical protein